MVPVVEGGVESGEGVEEIELEEGDGLVVEITVSRPSSLGQVSEGPIETGIQLRPYSCSGGQADCVRGTGDQNVATPSESLASLENAGCGGPSVLSGNGVGRDDVIPSSVRRTTRPTAGCHTNPFRLPQPVS